MDMLALGAVGVVAALFAVMVRQRAPEMALVLAMAACVLLLWNTLPLLESIRDVMEELASLTEISPWSRARAVGIRSSTSRGTSSRTRLTAVP